MNTPKYGIKIEERYHDEKWYLVVKTLLLMNNCKYRIKIEERNNGEKWYTPQVSFKKNWLGKQVWLNIVGRHFCHNTETWSSYYEHDTSSMSWRTLEEASNIIENHKLYLTTEYNKQIKTITYKEIE
jgi:hypothetical protein